MAAITRRQKVWIGFMIFISIWMVGILAAAAQGGYPAQQGTINDFAGILTPENRASIQAMLADLQRSHDIEMAVVTIKSIGDYGTGDTTIESFATRLFNRWGLGNAQSNRGVMLLVAVQDRKVRIELGRGYDSSYDQKAQNVIDEFILPAFRAEDYNRGIDRGVKGTIHAVTGAWPPGGEPSILDDPNLPGILGVGGLVGLGLVGFGMIRYYRHKCPGCGRSSLHINSHVLQHPTYSSSGQKEIERDCPHCGFHDTRLVTLAMLTYSSSSDSGSSSSSSDSGGGGSSDGGGASGSW